MDDRNRINPTLNFEIHDALTKSDQLGLTNIFNVYKSTANNNEFTASVENLAIAEYYVTKNINVYLQKIEKREIDLEQLVKLAQKNSTEKKNYNALYILANYVFFRKINRKYSAFVGNKLERMMLSVENNCFLESKFKQICCFPFLRLFLSQFNHFFNYNSKSDFLRNLYNIKKLQQAVKAFGKEEQKSKKTNSNLIYVSPIYGSFFYNISEHEQNNFNKVELEVIMLILNIQKAIMLKDLFNFDGNLTKLKEKTKELEKSHVVDMGKVHIRTMIEQKKKPFISEKETTKGYEKELFDKLVAHIKSMISFFDIYRSIFYDNDLKAAMTQLVSSEMFNKNGFKTLYSLSVENLIAIINFKTGNTHQANLCYLKSLERMKIVGAKENKKEESFMQLSRANNQIQQNAIHYNLALSYISCKKYQEAANLLSSLLLHFKNSYAYWYHLGTCYYHLFLKTLKTTAKESEAEFRKKINQDNAKYGLTDLKLNSINCENVLDRYKRTETSGDNKSGTKLSHLQNALLCFNNVLIMLEKNFTPELISHEFNSLKKKKIEIISGFKSSYSKKMEHYRTSSLEFIIFLNIMAKQYSRAYELINKALRIKGLKDSVYKKILIYKSQVELKLNIPNKKENVLDSQLANSKMDEKLDCFIATGSNNFVKSSMKNLLNFNRTISKFKTGACVNEEMDKMFQNEIRNGSADTVMEYKRQLLWAHYMYNKHDSEKIKELLGKRQTVNNASEVQI